MTVKQLRQILANVKDGNATITVGAMLAKSRHVYFEDVKIDCEDQGEEFIMSVDMKKL